MRRTSVILFWILSVIAGILVAGAIFLLLFLQITKYEPPSAENLEIKGTAQLLPEWKKAFTILSWNIGYAGLGKEMDFFYDGGKKVRPPRKDFRKYIAGICNLLKNNDSVDFIFIQEADIHAKRSYFSDESMELSESLKGYCRAFAKNYDCRFVPLPLTSPMGRVVSGLITFSKYRPDSAVRMDFGTNFGWPTNLAMLNRCFLTMRFRMTEGKELVLINTHNSAFDEKAVLREKELALLGDFMLKEYEKGNYVIAGGDWNQNPRGFEKEKIVSGDAVTEIFSPFSGMLWRKWQFVYDPSRPSNRDVVTAYEKGITKTTTIDFFVISPNLKAESVETLETGFENSDHQPVIFRIECCK
jgi:endonuclease/exonuclease/phosphatase family metal-dependent hydrolase